VTIATVLAELGLGEGDDASLEARLSHVLARLLTMTGARAGALAFQPRGEIPVVVTAGRDAPGRALTPWLRTLVQAPPPPAARLGRAAPPGHSRGDVALLRAPLGPARHPVGAVALAGVRERSALPAALPRDLGSALQRLADADRRTRRIAVLSEITRLGVSSAPLDEVLRVFGDGVASLVRCDALAVALLDAERGDLTVLDLPARSLGRGAARDERLPLTGTLAAEVARRAAPLLVPDLQAADVSPAGHRLVERGWRSALLVPLLSRTGVLGTVTLVAARPAAFDAEHVAMVSELAGPLASAVEQRRLLDEGRRQAEELAALYATSRLITSQLELAAVLEAISRAVTTLIGSTGCAIGLLDEQHRRVVHVAAQGVRSEAWSGLSVAVGEGIIGGCAEGGHAIRVDDVRGDPRSARRDVDEQEGIASMLCVPLAVKGTLIGVISAVSPEAAAFTARHQQILEAFAEQAGIAIHNARLFEESLRRARETRALLEAGRAVTASLDVEETIRVIMEEARSVLGVESCGIMRVDPVSGDLVSVASLDLPTTMVARIRLRPGEGIAGRAFSERRVLQSPDLLDDARVKFVQLPQAAGLRSMLSAPLRVGQAAIGAISVFRRDVHRFSPAEEELLLALADQAAIALEHARLYEQLEGMVAERTRELNDQKRFVEVVLETLPLGVFVLDAELAIVRANREAGRVFGVDAPAGSFLPALLPVGRARSVAGFLRGVVAEARVMAAQEEMVIGGEAKLFRLTAAPIEAAAAGAGPAGRHLVLLVEDITLAKRLERQMLLTERLTTAGRLAAGVAHELNNPLATIAGCAEALLSRTREGAMAAVAGVDDFRTYLGLIEEEAYRCKEITGSLLQFVRDPGSRRAPTDVNVVVQKTMELLSHQARFRAARFVTELDPDLPLVTANEGQLRQVFLGIAANGLEAMGSQGTLTIRSRQRREEIEVEFEDEGPGMPDEILNRIFDPFFTTKPPGQGTGLGLAIAQGIVTDHGGRIEVTSGVGKGTTFRVVLPR
jgi:signal transduction histidine kinase/putative methionine-R-sulfoxide reductase with GAF domain